MGAKTGLEALLKDSEKPVKKGIDYQKNGFGKDSFGRYIVKEALKSPFTYGQIIGKLLFQSDWCEDPYAASLITVSPALFEASMYNIYLSSAFHIFNLPLFMSIFVGVMGGRIAQTLYGVRKEDKAYKTGLSHC